MVLKAHQKDGVLYLFTVQPEVVAVGLYSAISNLVAANLLWVYVLMLCSSMDSLNAVYFVNRLIGAQVIFSITTSLMWWLIHRQNGESVVSHLVFYTWLGAKTVACILEIHFYPKMYNKIMKQTDFKEFDVIAANLMIGAFFILIIEFVGLYFAIKYWSGQRQRRQNSSKITRAFLDHTEII